MAGVQCSFERVEKKFVLTHAQAEALMRNLTAGYMAVDQYGQHTIRNLYYDTDDYALIRRSIQRPRYKVKFRLRAYGTPMEDTLIFAELKKKYSGVATSGGLRSARTTCGASCAAKRWTAKIRRFSASCIGICRKHPIRPKVFLAYERVALYGLDAPALRVTLDTHLRYRTTRLDCFTDDAGTLICPDDPVILEVKLQNAAPLWLARLLSRHKIYMSSFSKYGTCYLNHLARRKPDIRPMAHKRNNEGEIEHAS